LVLILGFCYDNTSFPLFYHGATNFRKKRHAYNGVGSQVLLWNGKKLGTSRQYWLADSRFLVLVILMDLFLYQLRHSDSDGNAQSLFVYTRHFVIVFGVPGAYYPGLEMSKRIGRKIQRDLEE
jgi:hypothetical protein